MKSFIRKNRLISATLIGAVALCAAGCVKKGAKNAPQLTPGGAPQGGNLIKEHDFQEGISLPWNSSFTQPGEGDAVIENGAYCLLVKNKGTNNWDAQIRHRELNIQRGHQYTVAFKIWSDKPTRVRVKVGMSHDPYYEYWFKFVELTPQPQSIVDQFTMQRDDDATAEFAFHAGGQVTKSDAPFKVCIDDVYLTDPMFKPAPPEAKAATPGIRLNQVGYLPLYAKHAMVVNESSAPLPWEIVSADDSYGIQGETKVFGKDDASGDNVHIIDFSAAGKVGRNYALKVGQEQSVGFDIANDIYNTMKYDAMAYFYHNRSGIEIKLPYAREPQWQRPAGHLNSDKAVRCAPEAGCNYTLDVTGGWYDAGDHGKYVVNGGISAWTLLNWFERTENMGTTSADFGDGRLQIPENKNGTPDILDEARWEVEFMLKMQVPEGQPKAGMVHHKIHDKEWTALAIRPDEAEKVKERFLRPVSTAATLNMAAVAAQASRVFKKYDAKFAEKCLQAAEKAFSAAKSNPAIFAPPTDRQGGGPYDDTIVGDEFYWAAAELYLTTGKDDYKEQVLRNEYHTKPFGAGDGGEGKGMTTAMTWQKVDALGTISLATVPSNIGAQEINAAREKIIKAADEYLTIIDGQGYRVPLRPGSAGYPWGSNSFVLNNMVVMGLAHDLTKQKKYVDGVVDSMDYILGANALGQSFVTGYGERPLVNPHHRFWSFQYDKKFPPAPPGAVSGGPNSGLQDPYVQAAGLKGCKPAKCFIDHIEAWSANEITINWNAPFVWATAYLDEMGQKSQKDMRQMAEAKKHAPAAPAAKGGKGGGKGGKAPAAPIKQGGAAKGGKKK